MTAEGSKNDLKTASSYLKHYYSLDIIKVIAAILIVFHHYQQVTTITFQKFNFYQGIIPFERIVELFFLISGALIYISDSTRRNANGQVKRLVKRIVHFYPITVLGFVIAYTVALISHHVLGEYPDRTAYDSIKCVITSLTLTHRGFPFLACDLGINNSTWYLCVLISCYLIYFCMQMLEKHLRMRLNFSR